jgi:phage repressor protein C with HTH and peptisase S24 domain
LLASLGSQAGQLTGADLQQRQSALAQMAQLAQQGQQMRTTDVAALEAAGSAQQQQAQREADAKYQQYMIEQQYPKSQLDWLSTQVRGMAPNVQSSNTTTTTGGQQTYQQSALQQLATGLSAGAGLTNLLKP